MADFIASGEYDHHLRKLRKELLGRNQVLVEALKENFGDVQLIGTDSGSEITWILPPEFPSPQKIRELANINGMDFHTLPDNFTYSPESNYNRAIVLRYGGLNEAQIREGISSLASVLGKRSTR